MYSSRYLHDYSGQRTLTTGARQLVVHEAAVQMVCSSESRPSLQPITTFRTPSCRSDGQTDIHTDNTEQKNNNKKHKTSTKMNV